MHLQVHQKGIRVLVSGFDQRSRGRQIQLRRGEPAGIRNLSQRGQFRNHTGRQLLLRFRGRSHLAGKLREGLGRIQGQTVRHPLFAQRGGQRHLVQPGAAAQIQRARPVDLCGEGHLELADLPRRLQKADPGHQRRRQARLLGLHLQRSVAGIRIFQQRLPDLLRRQRHAQNFPGFQERPGRHSIYCPTCT